MAIEKSFKRGDTVLLYLFIKDKKVQVSFSLFVFLLLFLIFYSLTLSTTVFSEGFVANDSFRLNISDNTDTLARYTEGSTNSKTFVDYDVFFYANFTNVSDNAAINGTCNITFLIDGTYTAAADMVFNASSLLHQYNRTFTRKGSSNYNVSCFNETYGNFTTNDTFVITNSQPLVQTDSDGKLENLTCYEDSECSFNFSINVTEDDTNDVMTYTYSVTTLTDFSLNSTTGVANFTCDNDNDAGNYTITFIVRDDDGLEDSGSKDYQIVAVNDVPSITTGSSLTDATYDVYYSTTISASDEESDAINWAANESFVNLTNSTATSALIQFLPNKTIVGTWNINVTANDSRGANTSKVFTLVINDANDAPFFDVVCDNNRTVDEEINLTCAINGSDPDGDSVSFTSNETFFNMNPNGTVSLFANDSDVGNYTITITITDSNSATNTTNISFNVTNVIESPIIQTNLTNITTYGWANFTLQINATDEDENLGSSPELVTFIDDSTFFTINTSGYISFTPNTSLNGTHAINITANDSNNQNHLIMMNLTIIANEPPVLDAIPNLVCVEERECNITITATDADGDTLTYYDNASRFTINVLDGNITFTPNMTDGNLDNNFTFLITINDSNNATAISLFRLNISNLNNNVPTVTVLSPNNASTVNVSENSSVRFLITTTDDDGDTIETLWYVDHVLNRSGEDIEDFNYTPGFTEAGIRNITVNISDGFVQNVSISWTVNVTNVNAPVFLQKNISNISITETTSIDEDLKDHFDDPDIYNVTIVNYTFFTTNQFDTMGNESEWRHIANDTVAITLNNDTFFIKQGGYSVQFTLDNSNLGAGTVNKNYSSQDFNDSLYMRFQLYVVDLDEICSGTTCNSSVSVLDVHLNLTNSSTNASFLSPITTFAREDVVEGWNSLKVQRGNDDWTGVHGVTFAFYGNNTTNANDTVFYLDDLEFASNTTTGLTITINETNDIATIEAARALGTTSLFFVANDSDYTAESNEISIIVTAASSVLTAVPVGAGGGGSRTEIISIKVDTPEGIVGEKFSLLTIPLKLINDGQVNLRDVTLEVNSTIKGMKFRFDGKSKFSSLDTGKEEDVTLNVDIGNVVPQKYTILVKASSRSPAVTDTARLQLEVIDELADEKQRLQKKLVFMVDLFKENPECLELQEILDRADKELSLGNTVNAEKLMDSVIDSCRDLITSKAERILKEKEEKFNWPLIIAGISVLSLVLLSYFSGKFTRIRIKRKK